MLHNDESAKKHDTLERLMCVPARQTEDESPCSFAGVLTRLDE